MLDRYPLDRPTADDLVSSLSEVVGPTSATAAIGVAVRDAVSPTASIDQLSPEQLLEVARALSRQRGVFAIIGRSFEIRMQSFLELEHTRAGTPNSPVDDAERARLRELAALDLGVDIDEPALQELVDRAAAEFELPIAAISIVLDAAQYFIASHGLGGWVARVAGTPGEWAFCRHAVESREPFVVEDATTHPLVRDNPVVHIDGIRCYLGIPLITREDQVLGTLCVIGTEGRSFTQADVDRLHGLAEKVLALLEARRIK